MVLDFLTYLDAKPLYYKKIDYTRIHKAYAILKPHIIERKIIHLVGTNGKGSIGRTMAHLIYESGHKVMHYSSPHILRFHERIWLNGSDSSDEVLEKAHQKLFGILGQSVSDGLSYFEYTTLLALVVGEECDWILFEAGLGGEFDATNAAPKVFSIITPIGLDHQDFLGHSIEAIATTKIESIDKQALLAIGTPKKVKVIAQKIAASKKAKLYDAIELISATQQKKIRSFGFKGYLVDNIATALVALDILQIAYDIEHLKTLKLFGRFYPLSSNI
ncbi:MAG: bifunctional folylpolyglutamate synthase/dihydrofolate synthase, partial [Campylobacterales bacterium]|nr:bifunctional folylpolyglutamate synthase/dihydrofolate synthase [Campylobacterales bacterium]